MTDKAAALPGERFWNRIANRYSKQPIADEDTYQKKLAITRDYFTPRSNVLELGCGTGSTAITHAPYVKHILVIDISSRMIEIAREKATDAHVENVTFEKSSIDELEAPPKSFEVILALSVLHLVADKEAVMARVHDMLKPGGVFVTSTACLGDSIGFRLMGLVVPIGAAVGLLPMVKVFTSRQLRKSIEDAGFEIAHDWQPGKNKAVFIVAKKRG